MESSYAVPLFVFLIGGAACGAYSEMVQLSPWQLDHAVSIPVAIIAGLWLTYPFHTKFRQARGSFLHPPATLYKVPLREAFAEVREILETTVFNMGDQWHVGTVDTNAKLIRAQIRFADQETRYNAGNFANPVVNTDLARRFMTFEARFFEGPAETTLITFDFSPRMDGPSVFACDRVVHDFYRCVDKRLGYGTFEETNLKPFLAPPPWFLILVTYGALGLLFLRILLWVKPS